MDNTDYTEWLEKFILRHEGTAGTVHLRKGDMLILVASFNIPPKVIELTKTIPRGKGMAGLAFERHKPVQTCNLKTDEGGDVRPGAKAVNAKAAVALPVDNSAGEVRAVVGIAYHDERELSDEQIAELITAAHTLS